MTAVTGRTVLVVDDEPAVVEILLRYLRDDSFNVVYAQDGPAAIELFERHRPDLVVLDVNLPGFPGTEVLRRMRSVRNVPIIMLTGRADEIDRVVGLELGADDYVSKPFSPREVVARVKTVLRRNERQEVASSRHERRIGAMAVDPVAREVRIDGKLVTLTPTQFKILDVLCSHVGQTLTRDQLLEHVTADGDVFDRTIDRHIANLRLRVEADPSNPRYIVTVLGVGYKMVNPA